MTGGRSGGESNGEESVLLWLSLCVPFERFFPHTHIDTRKEELSDDHFCVFFHDFYHHAKRDSIFIKDTMGEKGIGEEE